MTDLTIAGLIWYYFNIIGIAGIIFFIMMIAYNRSKQVVINTAEQPAGSKKMPPFLKFVVGMSIFGIIFFAVREWGDDIYEASTSAVEYIGEKIDS